MSVHEYTLSARVLSLYKGQSTCFNNCGAELVPDMDVVTRRSGGGMRKMYCRPCAIELNIIVEES